MTITFDSGTAKLCILHCCDYYHMSWLEEHRNRQQTLAGRCICWVNAIWRFWGGSRTSHSAAVWKTFL